MIRRYWPWGVLALGLSIGLACLGFALPFELILVTGFGWVAFLVRNAPHWSVSWSGVGLALICGAGVVTLAQAFGAWLFGEVAPQRPWRFRWTLSGFAAVVLMFSLGIAAAGVVHQVGWLLTTRERWVGSSFSAARRSQSVNNLHKQIGLALLNYAEVNGSLPPAATVADDGRLAQGWLVQIGPFFEETGAIARYHFDRPWDDPTNAEAIRTPIQLLQMPMVAPRPPRPDLPAPSHYAGNVWVLGGTRAWKLAEITDGTSNTVLVGEAAGNFRPWADPHSWRDPKLGINRHPDGFGSPWVGGANFLMADGSVRFVRDRTKQPTFEAICTPNGGERVTADEF